MIEPNRERVEAPVETESRETSPIKKGLQILVSVPGILVLVWLGSIVYHNWRVEPRGVVTITDFYVRYGDPPIVEKFLIQFQTYYKIIGEIPAPLAFPKGPPHYVFDSRGYLVDWTPEIDLDPEFASQWRGEDHRKLVTAEFLERFPPK